MVDFSITVPNCHNCSGKVRAQLATKLQSLSRFLSPVKLTRSDLDLVIELVYQNETLHCHSIVYILAGRPTLMVRRVIHE